MENGTVGELPGYALMPDVARRLAADGRRIVVTGAGGWLGMATLALLRDALGAGLAERVACFGRSAKMLSLNGASLEQRPISSLTSLECKPTLMLHCAFPARERAGAMSRGAYVGMCRDIRVRVLNALDAIGTEAVFLPSSGAVYEACSEYATPAMRLFGEMKQRDEEAFSDWGESRGRQCVTARIFDLSGPYINTHDMHALASFIGDALAGRPVRVTASKRVIRSYLAIRELMSVVFAQLLDGGTGGEPFDAASGDEVELHAVARTIAGLVGNGQVDSPSVEMWSGVDRYVGEPARFRTLARAAHVPVVDFRTQVLETAAYMSALDSRKHLRWYELTYV